MTNLWNNCIKSDFKCYWKVRVSTFTKKVSWVRGWANLFMRGQRLLTLKTLFKVYRVWYQMKGHLISSVEKELHLLNKHFRQKVCMVEDYFIQWRFLLSRTQSWIRVISSFPNGKLPVTPASIHIMYDIVKQKEATPE